MAHINQVYALAGLLGDPLLTTQREQIVPTQWLDEVKQAESAVMQAGKLAAGASNQAQKGRPDRPLQSVFSNIHTDEGDIPAPVFWPQASLALKEEVIIPKPKIEASAKPWDDFLTWARALKATYESAANDTLPVFVEKLQLLLQQHLWSLPCSYSDSLPDVSLYDHSRMTAALAAAMADYKAGTPVAQLVGGDLSGVQKFIYTITARGATSSLRGRSFYLQLLTEVIARYILRELGLPISSLIYAGGGNLYLLAPAGADLNPLREYISRALLYHHSGDLYLAISSVELKEPDFFNGRISQRWQDLVDRLNLAKLQTFAELGKNLSHVFEPQGHGGNEELQCQVCGLEHPNTSKTEPRKCPQCGSYEELGKDLRNARYLLFEEIKKDPIPSGTPVPKEWDKVLAHFGLRVEPSRRLPGSTRGKSSLFVLNDLPSNETQPNPLQAVGQRFLVNVTPTLTLDEIEKLRGHVEELPDHETVKPYDVMEDQSQGIKRMGVMRMDVDNLSKIIGAGYGNKATLSRIGALSFAINLFFEGWVAKLAEDINAGDIQEGRGERLYSIYSGGDDLFFVGSWDAVIKLTQKIRAELSRYAGDHPGIHASAGVALVGGKYPLYQAAQDAGRAEEQAKDHQWFTEDGKHHEKDAVTFLGRTMPWSRFGLLDITPGMQTVSGWTQRLEQAMREEGSPRALLGLLMNMQAQYDVEAEKRRKLGRDLSHERKVQVLWGPWNWLSAYYIKRMQKRTREESFKNMLGDVLKLIEKQFGSIQWIGLAARWAELKLRK